MQRHGSLNRAFRMIWNASLALWQVVAESAKGGRRAKSPKRAQRLMAASALLLLVTVNSAMAQGLTDILPAGESITAGSGSISESAGQMVVDQATDRMAIDWQSFSIGPDNSVSFKQPSSSSIALNRVLGSEVSQIQGALNANGWVFLLNPNGILFSTSAQVNVGGLVASTLGLSNDAFLNNHFSFSGDSDGSVVNQGDITATDGGAIVLIAATIDNSGSVTGNLAVGGLVGINREGGTISNSYCTGSVAGNSFVGGLVGHNYEATVTSSYWDTETSGQVASEGSDASFGKSSAEMKTLATFTDWDISAQGGESTIWRIYEGSTAPLLRSFFLAAPTLTTAADDKVYDGTTNLSNGGFILEEGFDSSLVQAGAATYQTDDQNVGSHDILARGIYSNQRGYDLVFGNGSVEITARPITVTADAQSKEEGDDDPAFTFQAEASGVNRGLVSGETLTGSLTRVSGEAPGTYQIQQGDVDNDNNANYNIAYTAASLTINGQPAPDTEPTTPAPDIIPLESAIETVENLADGDSRGFIVGRTLRPGGRDRSASPWMNGESGNDNRFGGLAFVEATDSNLEAMARTDQDVSGFMRIFMVNGGINLPELAREQSKKDKSDE